MSNIFIYVEYYLQYCTNLQLNIYIYHTYFCFMHDFKSGSSNVLSQIIPELQLQMFIDGSRFASDHIRDFIHKLDSVDLSQASQVQSDAYRKLMRELRKIRDGDTSNPSNPSNPAFNIGAIVSFINFLSTLDDVDSLNIKNGLIRDLKLYNPDFVMNDSGFVTEEIKSMLRKRGSKVASFRNDFLKNAINGQWYSSDPFLCALGVERALSHPTEKGSGALLAGAIDRSGSLQGVDYMVARVVDTCKAFEKHYKKKKVVDIKVDPGIKGNDPRGLHGLLSSRVALLKHMERYKNNKIFRSPNFTKQDLEILMSAFVTLKGLVSLSDVHSNYIERRIKEIIEHFKSGEGKNGNQSIKSKIASINNIFDIYVKSKADPGKNEISFTKLHANIVADLGRRFVEKISDLPSQGGRQNFSAEAKDTISQIKSSFIKRAMDLSCLVDLESSLSLARRIRRKVMNFIITIHKNAKESVLEREYAKQAKSIDRLGESVLTDVNKLLTGSIILPMLSVNDVDISVALRSIVSIGNHDGVNTDHGYRSLDQMYKDFSSLLDKKQASSEGIINGVEDIAHKISIASDRLFSRDIAGNIVLNSIGNKNNTKDSLDILTSEYARGDSVVNGINYKDGIPPYFRSLSATMGSLWDPVLAAKSVQNNIKEKASNAALSDLCRIDSIHDKEFKRLSDGLFPNDSRAEAEMRESMVSEGLNVDKEVASLVCKKIDDISDRMVSDSWRGGQLDFIGASVPKNRNRGSLIKELGFSEDDNGTFASQYGNSTLDIEELTDLRDVDKEKLRKFISSQANLFAKRKAAFLNSDYVSALDQLDLESRKFMRNRISDVTKEILDKQGKIAVKDVINGVVNSAADLDIGSVSPWNINGIGDAQFSDSDLKKLQSFQSELNIEGMLGLISENIPQLDKQTVDKFIKISKSIDIPPSFEDIARDIASKSSKRTQDILKEYALTNNIADAYKVFGRIAIGSLSSLGLYSGGKYIADSGNFVARSIDRLVNVYSKVDNVMGEEGLIGGDELFTNVMDLIDSGDSNGAAKLITDYFKDLEFVSPAIVGGLLKPAFILMATQDSLLNHDGILQGVSDSLKTISSAIHSIFLAASIINPALVPIQIVSLILSNISRKHLIDGIKELERKSYILDSYISEMQRKVDFLESTSSVMDHDGFQNINGSMPILQFSGPDKRKTLLKILSLQGMGLTAENMCSIIDGKNPTQNENNAGLADDLLKEALEEQAGNMFLGFAIDNIEKMSDALMDDSGISPVALFLAHTAKEDKAPNFTILQENFLDSNVKVNFPAINNDTDLVINNDYIMPSERGALKRKLIDSFDGIGRSKDSTQAKHMNNLRDESDELKNFMLSSSSSRSTSKLIGLYGSSLAEFMEQFSAFSRVNNAFISASSSISSLKEYKKRLSALESISNSIEARKGKIKFDPEIDKLLKLLDIKVHEVPNAIFKIKRGITFFKEKLRSDLEIIGTYLDIPDLQTSTLDITDPISINTEDFLSIGSKMEKKRIDLDNISNQLMIDIEGLSNMGFNIKVDRSILHSDSAIRTVGEQQNIIEDERDKDWFNSPDINIYPRIKAKKMSIPGKPDKAGIVGADIFIMGNKDKKDEVTPYSRISLTRDSFCVSNDNKKSTLQTNLNRILKLKLSYENGISKNREKFNKIMGKRLDVNNPEMFTSNMSSSDLSNDGDISSYDLSHNENISLSDFGNDGDISSHDLRNIISTKEDNEQNKSYLREIASLSSVNTRNGSQDLVTHLPLSSGDSLRSKSKAKSFRSSLSKKRHAKQSGRQSGSIKNKERSFFVSVLPKKRHAKQSGRQSRSIKEREGGSTTNRSMFL